MMSKALKLIRQYSEVKQADLANALGISKSYLSEIESGKKNISLDLLEKYAQYFDVPLSSLVFFSENLSKKGKISEKFRSLVADKILKVMEWTINSDKEEKVQA